jgi:hypothetical protein
MHICCDEDYTDQLYTSKRNRTLRRGTWLWTGKLSTSTQNRRPFSAYRETGVYRNLKWQDTLVRWTGMGNPAVAGNEEHSCYFAHRIYFRSHELATGPSTTHDIKKQRIKVPVDSTAIVSVLMELMVQTLRHSDDGHYHHAVPQSNYQLHASPGTK